MGTFDWILGFINFLLIIFIVFFERKRPGEALLWVVILTMVPVFGIIFYLVFGSTSSIKITYLIRSKKLNDEYRKIIYDQLNTLKNSSSDVGTVLNDRIKDLVLFNLNYSEGMFTAINDVQIITSGKDKYEKLFYDLEHAKNSIHIVYYGIYNDSVGKKLVEILTRKASQGVGVRLLYDGVGSLRTPNRMFKPLVKAGGKVKKLKPFITHFRNHRKIVVIDGAIAYTGGMNIGEKYMGLHKKKTPWRDTQIRIKGDAVFSLQYWFLYDWFYANSMQKAGLTEKDLQSLFAPHNIKRKLACQIVGSGVDTDKEYIKMSFLKMITSAKDRILLQTPYFIPDDAILDALKIAAASGVKVEIMIPGVNPGFFLQHTGNYYIDQLLEYGVKVYNYNGYIHAKTLTIDGIATCIGSVNMAIRSLQIDDEICAFFYDEQFVGEYERIYENDKKNSHEMDYEQFKNRSMWQRGLERFYRIFAPLM